MRKIIIGVVLTLLPSIAAARFVDVDGHLHANWSAPAYGDPVDHYIWSYNINGVVDSVTGSSPAIDTSDASVTLTNTSDWAIFSVRAVGSSGDTSTAAVSDTVVYSITVDVNDHDLLPNNFDISVYPNPVRTGQFALRWKVGLTDAYNVEIYNILGQRVQTVRDERMSPGEYAQVVTEQFPSGIYFAVIAGTDARRVVKFTILR
jgi:hypothetical protein